MRRRRRTHGQVLWDLETFDGADGAGEPAGHHGEPAGEDGEPAGETPPRRWRPRDLTILGLVVLVALSALVMVPEIQRHRQTARLLAAPGGVLSLAQPPARAWTAPANPGNMAEPLALLPGLVVTHHGTTLRGLDAATGAARWQVDVGDGAQCGVFDGSGTPMTVDPLVCLANSRNGGWIVTVVRIDGTSVTRDLAAADLTAVAATADGGLVTVARTGPTPPPPDVQVDSDGTIEGSIAHGQDAVVRWEDAATGAVRWQRTIAFRPVEDAASCGSVIYSSDSSATPTVDVAVLGIAVAGSVILVQGCGIYGAFTVHGDDAAGLTRPPSPDVLWYAVEPYVDGGALMTGASPSQSTSLLAWPDGTTTSVGDTDQVLAPLATDGTHCDVVLVASGDSALEARNRDGSTRWHSTLPVTQLLVRTGRVAVVGLGSGAVAGVDLVTRATLWVDSPAFLQGTGIRRNPADLQGDLASDTP
ncbi:MAG: hypothetical protein FWF28_06775, partial [Micrococcales bacterium]|nr:hypothetical protein [Micrococcales bacterium]